MNADRIMTAADSACQKSLSRFFPRYPTPHEIDEFIAIEIKVKK